MDRLGLLRAYVKIADHGSLSGAARELRVGQSTMSKWLTALEAEAGVPLVDRTTRALRLTEAGRAFLGRARDLVDRWDEALAEAHAQAPRVEGRIRASVPSVFGLRHVVPHLGAFLDEHPGLALELSLSDRYVSLLEEDLDVAIRVGLPVDSTLRSRKLGGTPRRLVASPRYLERAGAPGDPDDLARHDALVNPQVSATVWTFRRGEEERRVDVAGRVSADNAEALRSFARQGQGIALLASWLVDDDVASGELVRVLPDWEPPPAPIAALLPPARHVPARVRALLDHLQGVWSGALAIGDRGKPSDAEPGAVAGR